MRLHLTLAATVLIAPSLAVSLLGCTSPVSSTSARPSVAVTTGANGIRRPIKGATFQYQLDQAVDTGVNAQVYSIDGERNSSAVVTQLHNAGRLVMCYIDMGTWEEERPDAGRFPKSVMGKSSPDNENEKWLDIRQIDLLTPIIRSRMDMCKGKGFDGIEPDHIDGFETDTGFPLTYGVQLAFNTFIAQEAHLRGLSMGLKNDLNQSDELVDLYDWALSENCFEQEECDQLKPFINQGKAVFAVEYNLERSQFCPAAKGMGVTAIHKHQSVDAWVEMCA